MIDDRHDLPIIRQAQLLELSRSAVYYRAQPTSAADLGLMRRIDELHLEHPFAGARMLRDLLRQDGYAVGRKHMATLMRRMGIEALYRKANTSRRHPEHRIYPYLLRGLTIDRPNQAWAMESPTCRWRAASCISPWCWIGPPVAFWRGGCPTP
jgi:putative transposase